MNNQFYNILSLLKIFVFIIFASAMIIQPIVQTLVFVDQSDYKLVDIDGKEGPNEKESPEDDKDKKIELQIVAPYQLIINSNQKPICYLNQQFTWYCSLEIPFPPPDLI